MEPGRVQRGEVGGIVGPHRTYNDMPSGQTDPTLSNFSIAGDELWKLPMMQQAKALNPELTLMGTPWSAPAWMKTSGALGYGKLKPEYYATYAQYFVKWLDAWRANGMGISAITIAASGHWPMTKAPLTATVISALMFSLPARSAARPFL